MYFQYSNIAVASFATAGIALFTAWITWQRRSIAGGLAASFLMLAIAEWTFSRAFEAIFVEMPLKIIWAKIEYLGILSVPVLWLIFVLQYSRKDAWLIRRNILLLWIIPVITLTLVATNRWHGLIWRNIIPSPGRETELLIYKHGAWFWIQMAYSYLLMFAGTFKLAHITLSRYRLYKLQSLSIFTAAFIPWIGNAIYLSGNSPIPGLDLTPFAFTVTGLVLCWSIFRYRLFDLVPVARDSLIENMDDGVIVLDAQNRIIDINPAARHMFGKTDVSLVGKKADEVLDQLSDVSLNESKGLKIPTEIMLSGENSPNFVDLKISHLLFHDRYGHFTGCLISFRDITDRKKTETALRESKERFRKLSEVAEEGIAIHDKGIIIDANEALSKIFGYTLSEMIGMHVKKLASPGSGEKTANLITLGHDKPYEVIAVRKDGSTFYCQLVGKSYQYEGRNLQVATFRDITDLKESEEELQTSEELLRSTLESTADGILVVNEKGRVIKTNARFSHMWRIPDELIKLKDDEKLLNYVLNQLVDPEGFLSKVRELYQTSKEDFDTLLFKDGRVFERYSCPLIRGEKIAGRVWSFSDVTERKRSENVLRESEEKYRRILESIEDGYYEVDIAGNFTFFNDSICKFFGYSKDELLGMNNREYMDEKNAKKIFQAFNSVFRTGKPYKGFDWEVIRKDGSRCFVEASVSLRKDSENQPIGFQGIVRDISERKKAEEEKSKLEAQLIQAQKMEAIGTLAGGIAHDFNNLLMGIQGHTSLMSMKTDASHPHFQHLKAIEANVKSASGLTGQLLGFARGGKYEVKPINLNNIINNSSEMFGRTKKEITIHRKFQEDIWPVEVDQTQIEQVLLNLYVNAWQAMSGTGELSLDTKNVSLDESFVKPYGVKPGKFVKIAVSDTGIGMDEAIQQRIFDPFFTTKEKSRGTGLGLASAFGIIRSHGGIINVYSEIGKGATFNIYLPVSEKKVKQGKQISEEVIKGAETLLLIDDEEMIIEVGQEMLENLGYTVLSAKSGREGISMYRKYRDTVDGVILDMIMPVMGGSETYDRLKAINPAIKVLLSSGYSIDGLAKTILAKGCDGFIQKPFSLIDLSQKLRGILDEE